MTITAQLQPLLSDVIAGEEYFTDQREERKETTKFMSRHEIMDCVEVMHEGDAFGKIRFVTTEKSNPLFSQIFKRKEKITDRRNETIHGEHFWNTTAFPQARKARKDPSLNQQRGCDSLLKQTPNLGKPGSWCSLCYG